MKVLIVLACLACAVRGGVIAPAQPGDGLVGIMPIGRAESAESEEQNETMNLGEAVDDYLNEIRKAMPCGNEQLHLPKLAPFRMEKIPIVIDDEELKVKGSISNLMVSGMNKFEFVGRSYEESNNFFTYDMVYPELSVMAEYDMDTWFRVAGMPVSFNGEGLIDVKFVDLRVVGQLAVSPNGNGTQLTDFDFKIYLGDVVVNNWNNLWPASVNKFQNKFQSSLIMMLSEQLRDLPAQLYNKDILPQVNEAMASLSVQDLIKFMSDFAHTLKKSHCKAE